MSRGGVILFRGKAGVGKTALSDEIGRRLCLPIIRKDDIYDALSSYLDDHNERNRACYDIIHRLLETSLKCGAVVVLDTGLHDPAQIEEFRTWIRERNAELTSFLCICSDQDLWAERFDRRKVSPKPNNVIVDFDSLRLHYGDLDTAPILGEQVLDSVRAVSELVEEAIETINSWQARRQSF